MSLIGKRIDAVVRAGLVPDLRAAGFRKVGRTFRRPLPLGVQVVNVQASQWNAGAGGSFTVNLGVYLPAVAALDAAPPRPAPADWDCHIRERIGMVMAQRQDYWWELTAGSDDAATAADLRETWQRVGPGWFAARERPADLVAAAAHWSPWAGCKVAVALGNREAAVALWGGWGRGLRTRRSRRSAGGTGCRAARPSGE